MLRLYDDPISGNGYKLRLALMRLGLPFEYVALDIMKSETRTAAFLALNPNGRIPTLRLGDGTHLAESNAILWYLAEGTALAPAGRLARAQTLQWMFFEQYEHEPNIAVARFWRHLPHMDERQQRELPERMRRGVNTLQVMERHLGKRDFFVGDAAAPKGRFGLADICLYAYTHVAPEGGFDLAPYPAINAWLARVAAGPGHVAITDQVGIQVIDAALRPEDQA
ncbi:MAG: glutathione S-transferase family protein [Rhodospirillaceae bacterium]|nr:glutathione S-transferase family protein [Rhodospirillaceae bacterium]